MIYQAKTLHRTVHQIFKVKDTLIQTTPWIYFWNYHCFSEHLCQLQKEKTDYEAPYLQEKELCEYGWKACPNGFLSSLNYLCR